STNDPTTIPLIGEPELTLTKVVSSDTLSTPTASGDTISYSITIANTGQLPVYDIVLDDTLLGGDITASCVFPIDGVATLEVSESALCTPDPYSVIEFDIAQGYIDNNAFVEGFDQNNDSVFDESDAGDELIETSSGDGTTTDGDPTNDPTAVTLIQAPSWEIEKSARNTPENVGDTIEYNFAITNTGNLTIENPVVSDSKCEGFIYYIDENGQNNLTYTLAPEETKIITCFSIPVTQEEIDVGVVNNTVTASGATILGSLPEIMDDHELSVPANPEWNIQKFALNPAFEAGDVIEYEFLIQNTGNVSIQDIVLTDEKCATPMSFIGTSDIGSEGLLGQGEVWEYRCTSIPTTQEEADASQVVNTVTANGVAARGSLPEATDMIETPIGPFPFWDIEKTLNTPIEQAGDELKYSFKLENRGNVTISDITVTDEKCILPPVLDVSTDINGDNKLTPLEIWTYNCDSIPVTQVEVDNGEVLNNVVASGTPAQGILDDAFDVIISEVPANPNWTLEKTTDSLPQFAGETLDYVFTVTNTGNTTLSSIILSDEKCSTLPSLVVDSDLQQDSLLSPSEAWVYECTSIPVTQNEVNNESIVNTVNATVVSTRGSVPVATSMLTTPVGLTPALQLFKTAVFNDENADGKVAFAETISYSFSIKNVGNIDVTNISLSDENIEVSGGPIDILKVGETDTTTFSGDYFIIQPDVQAGYVENTASVSGSSIGGDVSDISDAGDDVIETANALGETDDDTTNDPTIVRFSEAASVNTGSSGGSGSSSSSSSSSGGSSSGGSSGGSGSSSSSSSSGSSSSTSSSSGGSSSTISGPLGPVIPNEDTSPTLLSGPEDLQDDDQDEAIEQKTITPEVNENLTPEQVKAILHKADDIVKNDDRDKDVIERLIAEQDSVGESELKALPNVLPQTGTPISERITTRVNSRIETNLPNASVFRLAGDENSNIEHWKQVLPEQDKDAGKYIVVPSNGLVIPVNEFEEGSEDFDKMINGREANINSALKGGTLEYPGTSTNGYGEVGNKVIFGHSSYWTEDDGRYKTHFQKIIELDVGEEIWVYEKNETGEYQRFVYITQESYNT
ncbi:hypothetical protein N9J72_03210, partial [Candidatus Gracilibacteria bacterium]|nr:hypothetical protein [Candidatus Gracilibacteria bacterium]